MSDTPLPPLPQPPKSHENDPFATNYENLDDIHEQNAAQNQSDGIMISTKLDLDCRALIQNIGVKPPSHISLIDQDANQVTILQTNQQNQACKKVSLPIPKPAVSELAVENQLSVIPPYVCLMHGKSYLSIFELEDSKKETGTLIPSQKWLSTLDYGGVFNKGSKSSRTAKQKKGSKVITGPEVAVFGNSNWVVIASSSVLAVWDWELVLSGQSTIHSTKPSRLISVENSAEELEVLLDPVAALCHIDARCRTVLCSRRSILVYDVARGVELFRHAMSIAAPAIGPFRRTAWNGTHVATLEPRGLRVWDTSKPDSSSIEGPVRGLAPVLLPDIDSAPFTALSFYQKTTIIVGDALGRIRVLDATKAPPLVSLSVVTKMLTPSSSSKSNRPSAIALSDDESDATKGMTIDGSSEGTSEELSANSAQYGTMPSPSKSHAPGLSERTMSVPAFNKRKEGGDSLGIFAELIKSARLATLKAAVKRKLPGQLADLRLLRDTRHRTALHVAAERNRVEIARYLIRKSDPEYLNTHDNLGRTPLHTAATSHASEICRLLLRAGARAARRDVRGSTPMHSLVQRRWPPRSSSRRSLLRVSDALRTVIADGALPPESDADPDLPAAITASALQRATAQELRALSEGSSSNKDKDTSESTGPRTISQAVADDSFQENNPYDDDLSLASLLACFAALVGINARDADESTPLMVACAGENVEAVRVLLHCGADIEVARGDGDTALHAAVRGNAPQCASLLLAKNASPLQPNRLGDSPLALAKRLNRDKLVELLQRYEQRRSDDNSAGGSGSAGSLDSVGGGQLAATRSAHQLRKRSGSDRSLGSATSGRRLSTAQSASAVVVSSSSSSKRRPSLTPSASSMASTASSSSASASSEKKKLTFRAKIAKKMSRSSDVSEDVQKAWLRAANNGAVDQLNELVKKIGSAIFLVRDKHEQTALHRAAFKGHTAAVAMLLSHKKSPNDYIHQTDKNGWIPLHGAVSEGHYDVSNALLDAGSDPGLHALEEHGGTAPIHYAVRQRWRAPALPNLLNRMLQSNENVLSVRDADGATPLHAACWKGGRETVAFLLGKKAALHERDDRNEGVLHYAARGNQSETLELLLARGADVLATGDSGQTAMDVANELGAEEAARALNDYVEKRFGRKSLTDSANVSTSGSSASPRSDKSSSNRSSSKDSVSASDAVLFEAARSGDLDVVKSIIKKSPVTSFDAEDDQGRNILHVAVAGDHRTMATWLLAYKKRPAALVHRTDKLGLTPLHIASGAHNLKLTQLLVQCGSDSFAPAGSRHSTPLHELVCAEWRGPQSVQLLDAMLGVSEADASIADAQGSAGDVQRAVRKAGHAGFVDPRNAVGATPLMCAAAAGRPEACQYLISRGARTDVTDVTKDSLVHYAVRGGSGKVMELMLENKVPHKMRGAHETPIQMAKRLEKKECEAVLRARAEQELMERREMRSSFRFLGTQDWKAVLGSKKPSSSSSSSKSAAALAGGTSSGASTPSSVTPTSSTREEPSGAAAVNALLAGKPTGPPQYITSSAPTAVLHCGPEASNIDTIREQPLFASIEQLLICNDRVFVAQRGGAMSAWEASARGAWQPLSAHFCGGQALRLSEYGGTVMGVFFIGLDYGRTLDDSSIASAYSSSTYDEDSSSADEPLPLRRRGTTPIPVRKRDDAAKAMVQQLVSTDDSALVDVSKSNESSKVPSVEDDTTTLCECIKIIKCSASFKKPEDESSGQRIAAADLTREKEIGKGAFGSVWKGTWRGQVVAIKAARVDKVMDASQESLVDEAERLAALPPHPHVLRLFGVCEKPLCLVTEFCALGSLNSLLYGDKPDPIVSGRVLDRIVVDAALGLYHLHAHRVVHRDIAARNILVDGKYRAKVADFGMARAAVDEESGAYTESAVGPLKWMAPEQLERRKYSSKSDVWSFGCVMYECYSRRKPWDGYTNAAAVHKVLSAQRMAPPRDAPPVVCELMRRCWHARAKKRPSMAQICTALSAAVTSDAVESEYGDMLSVYPEIADFELEPEKGDNGARPKLESAISPRE